MRRLAPILVLFLAGCPKGAPARASPAPASAAAAPTPRQSFHRLSLVAPACWELLANPAAPAAADEIRMRWDCVEGIAIVQRIGRQYPRTRTVVIACSAGHRDTGVFEAARYGIDRLKEIVPVWKKEVGPGGEGWVEGKADSR